MQLVGKGLLHGEQTHDVYVELISATDGKAWFAVMPGLCRIEVMLRDGDVIETTYDGVTHAPDDFVYMLGFRLVAATHDNAIIELTGHWHTGDEENVTLQLPDSAKVGGAITICERACGVWIERVDR